LARLRDDRARGSPRTRATRWARPIHRFLDEHVSFPAALPIITASDGAAHGGAFLVSTSGLANLRAHKLGEIAIV
jgi:hypothetical protein